MSDNLGLTYKPGVISNVTAAEDVTAKKFINFDGNLCGEGLKARGVSRFDADEDEEITLIQTGEAVVTSGGAIPKGKPVASDSEGRAVLADEIEGTTNLTGEYFMEINGYSLTETTSEDEEVLVLLR